jgi:hypothetical protein
MGASWGIGSPIAEGGVAATAGAGGAALITVLELIVCASDEALAAVLAAAAFGASCAGRAGAAGAVAVALKG